MTIGQAAFIIGCLIAGVITALVFATLFWDFAS